jgi:transposase
MEMAEKRNTYTREFKVEAVRLLETSGKPGHEIEKELGIGSGQVYRWRAQLAQEGSGLRAFPGNGKPRDEELATLRKENKNLREERDILRKAVAIFSRPQR